MLALDNLPNPSPRYGIVLATARFALTPTSFCGGGLQNFMLVKTTSVVFPLLLTGSPCRSSLPQIIVGSASHYNGFSD